MGEFTPSSRFYIIANKDMTQEQYAFCVAGPSQPTSSHSATGPHEVWLVCPGLGTGRGLALEVEGYQIH